MIFRAISFPGRAQSSGRTSVPSGSSWFWYAAMTASVARLSAGEPPHDTRPDFTNAERLGPSGDIGTINRITGDTQHAGYVPQVLLRPAFAVILHLLDDRVLG